MGKIHDALRRAEQQRGQLPDPSVLREAIEPEIEDPLDTDSEVRSERAIQVRRPRKKSRKERRAERKNSDLTRRDRRNEERRPRVLVGSTTSNVTEEYRTLRARLQSLRRTRDLSRLVITSARPNEGKTTTAINLALSFGMERELKTCLIDADLRTPGVSQVFGPAPEAGLAEVLEADAKLSEALIELPDSRLSVLPVKALPTYPSELLGSRRMAELLDELSTHFDMLIIDAPPVLGLPDAVTLVDACDSALFVVGAGRVDRSDVDAALERLDASKVVGTVLNRCAKNQAPYGSYGYGKD